MKFGYRTILILLIVCLSIQRKIRKTFTRLSRIPDETSKPNFSSDPQAIKHMLEEIQKQLKESTKGGILITTETKGADYLISEKRLKKASLFNFLPITLFHNLKSNIFKEVFYKTKTLEELIEKFITFIKNNPNETFPRISIKFLDLKEDKIKWKLLGAGNYGEVYEEIINGDLYASKYVKKKENKNQEIESEREIRMMLGLDHTNVIKLYGFFDNKIIMEYATEDLENLIEKHYKDISDSQKIKILKEIGEGINYLHEQGLIHSDLKPENILLDKEFDINSTKTPTPKIADFGLSSFAKCSNKLLAGTLNYEAPEIVYLGDIGNRENNAIDQEEKKRLQEEYDKLFNDSINTKNDVYSFGMIVYYVFTGKIPFEGKKIKEIYKEVLSGNYPNIESDGSELKEKIKELIKHCTEKDYNKRITMEQAVKELEALNK